MSIELETQLPQTREHIYETLDYRLYRLFSSGDELNHVDFMEQLRDIFDEDITALLQYPLPQFKSITKEDIKTHPCIRFAGIVLQSFQYFKHFELLPTLKYLFGEIKIPFFYHEFHFLVYDDSIRYNTVTIPLIIQVNINDRFESLQYLHQASKNPDINHFLPPLTHSTHSTFPLNTLSQCPPNELIITQIEGSLGGNGNYVQPNYMQYLLLENDSHNVGAIDLYLRNTSKLILSPRAPIIQYLTEQGVKVSSMVLMEVLKNDSPVFLDRKDVCDILFSHHLAGTQITKDHYSILVQNMAIREERYSLFLKLYHSYPKVLPSNFLLTFLTQGTITPSHFPLIEWWFRQPLLKNAEPNWSTTKIITHVEFDSLENEILALQKTLFLYSPILSRFTCLTYPIDMASSWLHKVLIPRVIKLFKLVRLLASQQEQGELARKEREREMEQIGFKNNIKNNLSNNFDEKNNDHDVPFFQNSSLSEFNSPSNSHTQLSLPHSPSLNSTFFNISNTLSLPPLATTALMASQPTLLKLSSTLSTSSLDSSPILQSRQSSPHSSRPATPTMPSLSTTSSIPLLTWLKRFLPTFDAAFTGFYTKYPARREHHTPHITTVYKNFGTAVINACNCSNSDILDELCKGGQGGNDSHLVSLGQLDRSNSNNNNNKSNNNLVNLDNDSYYSNAPSIDYEFSNDLKIVPANQMSKQQIELALIEFNTTFSNLLDFLPSRLVFDSALYNVQFPARTNLPLQLYATVEDYVVPTLLKQIFNIVYQSQRIEAFLKTPTHLIRHQEEANLAQGKGSTFLTLMGKKGTGGNLPIGINKDLFLHQHGKIANMSTIPSSRSPYATAPTTPLQSTPNSSIQSLSLITPTTQQQKPELLHLPNATLGVCLQAYFDQLYETTLSFRTLPPGTPQVQRQNQPQTQQTTSKTLQYYGSFLRLPILQHHLFPLNEMPIRPNDCTCPIPTPEKLQRLLFEYLFPIFPATSVLIQAMLSNSPVFKCVTYYPAQVIGGPCILEVVSATEEYFRVLTKVMVLFNQYNIGSKNYKLMDDPSEEVINEQNELIRLYGSGKARKGNYDNMYHYGAVVKGNVLKSSEKNGNQNDVEKVGKMAKNDQNDQNTQDLLIPTDATTTTSSPAIKTTTSILQQQIHSQRQQNMMNNNNTQENLFCGKEMGLQMLAVLSYFFPAQCNIELIFSKYKNICYYLPKVYQNIIIYTFFLLHRLDLILHRVDPKTASCPIIPYFSPQLKRLQVLLTQFLEVIFKPTFSSLGLKTLPITKPLLINNDINLDHGHGHGHGYGNDDVFIGDANNNNNNNSNPIADKKQIFSPTTLIIPPTHINNSSFLSKEQYVTIIESMSPYCYSKVGNCTHSDDPNEPNSLLNSTHLTRLQKHYQDDPKNLAQLPQSTLLLIIMSNSTQNTPDINFWDVSTLQTGMYGQSHPDCFRALALETILDVICTDLIEE